MIMENQKIIYVYENWSNNLPNLIGILYVDKAKGKENYSFTGWLSLDCKISIKK